VASSVRLGTIESMIDADTPQSAVPRILAGPILRRATTTRLILWLVTRDSEHLALSLYRGDDGRQSEADDVIELASSTRRVQIGTDAWLLLVDLDLAEEGIEAFPQETPIGYDLLLGEERASLAVLEPGLCYPGESRPRFVVRTRLNNLLHGSCRRPHNASGDGMARADRWVAAHRTDIDDWPTMMLLTGDQIYADDVAGPMLRAIHALIDRIGLWPEALEGATVADSGELYASPHCYYQRDQLLPQEKTNTALRDRFFGGTRKPIFTSATAGNHLVTLAEVLAMYLLCWSDTPWRDLSYSVPDLTEAERERYDEEAPIIQDFVTELPAVRRVMANTVTPMIFDDHDITDDWNLTALWEDTAYGHPYSKRIIGNALVAYLLCQGWGNRPEVFDDTIQPIVERYAQDHDADSQNTLIDALIAFREWGFTLETDPAVVVLDIRTSRWRRERQPSRPSGLMDWEALTDMQQALMDRRSVVLVAATPIFGVKLIENVQRIFTFFGFPLMVDAENWMAHSGTASVVLNVFRHRRTPGNFTILSGDVHYSFVYDVALRFSRARQKVWQITSSGVKNQFPETLLTWFDRLNRWLYAPWSPLNWFTQRRRMRVTPRRPRPAEKGQRLVNRAGMGYVRFNDAGQPVDIRELGVDDVDVIFEQREEHNH